MWRRANKPNFPSITLVRREVYCFWFIEHVDVINHDDYFYFGTLDTRFLLSAFGIRVELEHLYSLFIYICIKKHTGILNWCYQPYRWTGQLVIAQVARSFFNFGLKFWIFDHTHWVNKAVAITQHPRNSKLHSFYYHLIHKALSSDTTWRRHHTTTKTTWPR